MPLIDIIAGARPNFMKIAPIIRGIEESQINKLSYRLIHTGQHYDNTMSGSFFEQLNIPEPHINLEVGSGTQAEQTGAIMFRYEKILLENPSDICIVVGDVTSTMACAITAQKMKIPVAHVEAGIRSKDWTMPEEINRMVTDSISNYFFTTSTTAGENLRNIGVPDDRIFFVGNTMIDTLLSNINRLKKPTYWSKFDLKAKNYLVLTLHRPSNVDERKQLTDQLFTIAENSHNLPIIFPVHPRTAKTLQSIKDLPHNIYLVPPQPYLQFIYLIQNSKAVITDSGGITEETTILKVPCMTLRDTTERPETVFLGTNELIGTDNKAIKPSLDKLFADNWKQGTTPEKWDGKSGLRIVCAIEDLFRES